MGGVGNGAAEGDWCWDLNLDAAAMLSGDHTALGCSLLLRGLGSRRDAAGRKGVNGLLLVGQEKVSHGFGLKTGDRGGDTANGAGSRGRSAS